MRPVLLDCDEQVFSERALSCHTIITVSDHEFIVLIHNYSPFVPFAFRSGDPPRAEWWTVIVKSTHILRRGKLEVHPEQEPVLLSEEYRHGPGSSLRRDGDLVPRKLRADVHIVGTARAARGEARTDWLVSVSVGAMTQVLRVTGPRAWRRSLGGSKLSPAEPCLEVPLCYELAFGGCSGELADEVQVFAANPVGRGFRATRTRLTAESVLAPQIEAIDDPIGRLGPEYTAVGVTPIPPSWPARRLHAGTYDQRWLETCWPCVPDDFSEAFYNSASAGLKVDGFLVGNERVRLCGVNAGGNLDFSLPGYQLCLVVRLRNGLALMVPHLDTLVLDVDTERVVLVWRARIDAELGLRKIEVHLRQGLGQVAPGPKSAVWR